MEARKVQITGKSTYMITLPKKWAVDVGLQPGSLVSITHRDDGSLLLTPAPKYGYKTCEQGIEGECTDKVEGIGNQPIDDCHAKCATSRNHNR